MSGQSHKPCAGLRRVVAPALRGVAHADDRRRLVRALHGHPGGLLCGFDDALGQGLAAAEETIEEWLAEALLLGMTEAEACQRFTEMVDTTAFAVTQRLKNLTHDISLWRKVK